MDDCIFCKIVAGEIPAAKVYETESAIAFFDINPANEYHTLVIPKEHHRDIFDISKDALQGVISTLKDVVDLYREKLGLENVQIINSSGADAQQDVFHIHFSILLIN